MLRIGVDVGGTFTDGFLIDTETGAIRREKVLSTPADQSEGTLGVIKQFGAAFEDLGSFAHGSTVGLNALLQRTGVLTGLLCTEGTRDLLDMGRLRRPYGESLYDPTWMRPHLANPIVHRRHIREIRERLRSDGSVHIPLDEDAAREEIAFLRDEGIEAIAICLLHAYENELHEARLVELVREVHPDAYVQSSRVRPVVGEYARTLTTVIDANVGPLISRYLKSLRRKLSDVGFDGPLQIMQMNGGVRTLEATVESFPAYALSSGPVAGVLGAEHYAREFAGAGNLVCVDIGGTSTDIGIVSRGKAHSTDNWEFEFNMPLGAPALDVRSLGAGGGSIIHADEMGTLQVGPQSAGAEPGPACYGRGGIEPTITDAYVALGVIHPDLFLAGRMQLDAEASMRALRTVADRLQMDPIELAEASIRLMNVYLESEIAKMAFEQALDLSEFSLLAYGGAGALPASRLTRTAGLKQALIPFFPGGFSAFGLVTAPIKVEKSRSVLRPIDGTPPEEIEALFDELELQARDEIERQGYDAAQVSLFRSVNGMYGGQSFDNRIAFPDGALTPGAIASWKEAFNDLYERLYGYSAPEMGIIVTSATVTASVAGLEVELPRIEEGGREPAETAIELRGRVFDGGVWHDDVPFFRRDALLANNVVEGPAVIDDGLATVFIDSRALGVVDASGNIHISATDESRTAGLTGTTTEEQA